MGNKKKFIDKKKAATFQLMARDTSDPHYSSDPSGDRVFVRVDNNPHAPDFFYDGYSAADGDSIFADAPDEEDCDGLYHGVGGGYAQGAGASSLPDHVRKEILELGFPDDGYNYLLHLREIKNTGGGSAYFHNPKASLEPLPQDVKAYDASKVKVSKINDPSEEGNFMYNVASNTVGVKLQKVVDPDVSKILDDSDFSDSRSDDEELEEDFVSKANVLDESAEKIKEISAPPSTRIGHLQDWDSRECEGPKSENYVKSLDSGRPRERRPLDEQFDLLELNEYGDDGDEELNGYMEDDDDCQKSFTEKINSAFKNHPSELLHQKTVEDDEESPEVTAEVIRRCREYAERYENEDHEEVEVVVEESSSDESEQWDCETIVTTYSTLDNHPGKIAAPEARRKKKLAEALFSGANPVITLKGKERLPVDFLPGSRKHSEENVKEKDSSDQTSELQKKKPRAQESKEEKKARKSAVKSERREARQTKKEMKGLYKSEANRAQKVAAFTGPSSIHLM